MKSAKVIFKNNNSIKVNFQRKTPDWLFESKQLYTLGRIVRKIKLEKTMNKQNKIRRNKNSSPIR